MVYHIIVQRAIYPEVFLRHIRIVLFGHRPTVFDTWQPTRSHQIPPHSHSTEERLHMKLFLLPRITLSLGLSQLDFSFTIQGPCTLIPSSPRQMMRLHWQPGNDIVGAFTSIPIPLR
jgi:hypothetical protein